MHESMDVRFRKSRNRDDKDGDTVTDRLGRTASHNGYCWTFEGDEVYELGVCPECYRYWGASIKRVTCVCGASVSLT